MIKKQWIFKCAVLTCCILFFILAIMPILKKYDSAFAQSTEADCRVCHDDPNIVAPPSNVDRHHLRVGTIIGDPTVAPYGNPGEQYECLTCHAVEEDTGEIVFRVERDCIYCHGATSHREQHESTNTECTACHQSNLQDTHNQDCNLCHESVNPAVIDAIDTGNTDCLACHMDPPHAESCMICHTDKNFSDYIGRSVEIHDEHKDKVICGICHAIPEQIEFGPPARSCGQMCHGGKQRKPAKELHGIHMSRYGILPNSCYWCHGKSIPERPANSCDLCHIDKSADAPTSHKRHGKEFECTTCHTTVAGFGPDVRFDPNRDVCRTCHDPKFKSQFVVHEKHLDRAQCYACHGDSNVYAALRGDKDCTICHEQRSNPFYQVHQRHAGQAMMCTVCHSLVPPNVEGVQGYGAEPPPPPLPGPENQPPVADAGPNTSAVVAEEVQFDGSQSSDPDGTIVSYEWDFGDGSTATGVTVSHIYSSDATYPVTLTVTDNEGATAADIALVTVDQIPAHGNLALNKTTSASDDEGSSYRASNATDGSMSTRWWVKSSHNEWLRVDLGSVYNVNRVALYWHSEYAEDYDIEVSQNGWNWTRVKAVRDGNGGVDDLLFSGRDARYVRVMCKKERHHGYSIYELEIYSNR